MASQAEPPRSRLRVGAVALLGVTVVTIVALCVLVPSAANEALSLHNEAHHSGQCQACLGRVKQQHVSEHESLSSELSDCHDSNLKCVRGCDGRGDSDCHRECHLVKYKCSHDAIDRHKGHLGVSGSREDHHECHSTCHGLSAQCQLCLDELHDVRERERDMLAEDTDKCNNQLLACYTGCEKNDKGCRISCDRSYDGCHDLARERDRTHLGIHAMVQDRHNCMLLCDSTEAIDTSTSHAALGQRHTHRRSRSGH